MNSSIKDLLQREAQAVLNIPVTDGYEKAVNLIVEQVHEKDGKQYRADGNAADCLNGVMAYGLLVLRLFAGTLQGFL